MRKLAHERPGATVVCADDGEKFGAWPETFDHVFTRGWLRRFCDMIRGNRDWLRPTTFAEAVDATLPLGKIYLPDGSYREMTEWALPSSKLIELKHAQKHGEGHPAADRLKPFVRAGGFWRNFKARYAESDEMYARMLDVSHRLAAAEAEPRGRPRLPRRRPPGALPGSVQLPVLARVVRRPVPAPPPERDLPAPDRRPQRARRRRGADRPEGLARRGRLQPRRPPGGPPRKRPAHRLRPPGVGRARLRAGRPPRLDQRPEHARPPPRALPRRDRRGRRPVATHDGADVHARPRGLQARRARPDARLRPPPPQGARRPLPARST